MGMEERKDSFGLGSAGVFQDREIIWKYRQKGHFDLEAADRNMTPSSNLL